MLITKSKSKSIHTLDQNSFLLYIESHILSIISNLGILKIKSTPEIHFFLDNIFFCYNWAFFKYKKLLFLLYSFLNNIDSWFKSIFFGGFVKYKVIGLGHRGYYSKNTYLFKIGYSHLVFCFMPFIFSSKKKQKKKPFHKIIGLSQTSLDIFFFHIQNMRIPDIYSKNGIYSRNNYICFKKGKKSFLL